MRRLFYPHCATAAEHKNERETYQFHIAVVYWSFQAKKGAGKRKASRSLSLEFLMKVSINYPEGATENVHAFFDQ
jgi:hypothetical protein